MDILSVLQTNFLSLVLGVIVFVLLWMNRGKKSSFERLPPGPPPSPIVGNLFQIDLAEPYKYYLQLCNKYGSVCTIWLANKPVIILSGYQAIKDALVTQGEEFNGRAQYPLLVRSTNGFGVLASSGQRWKYLRRFSIMTLKNFGMGRRSVEERVQEEARSLVKAFHEFDGAVFNPKELLCNAVSNVICSIVFGHRFEYKDPEFLLLYDTVNAYFDVLNSPIGILYNTFPKFVECIPGKHKKLFALLQKAQDYVKNQAEIRLKHLDANSTPQDYTEAFMIKMIQEKDLPNSEFHYDNLVSSVWNLFAAGTETTSSTMRHALLMMIKHPDIQARVHKEIDEVIGQERSPSMDDRSKMPYTDAVIHEVQRSLDLAPTSVPHKVNVDTEFKKYFIPKDTMVLPLLSSVLIDPNLWKNPENFDPENFLDEKGRFKKNDAFLVFGLGKRACLGEGLARMELFLFFSSLLQHFTFVGTKPAEEIDTTPTSCSFGMMPRSYDFYAKPRA
ncbi:cytochrome P450 2M1-like isoform X2 [Clupea harengus]|uniref:Cytochrome P450 2M1-like isoform X2 n=1 Tax=Clupea harengus TaxID=7950 RepID=A0A8M1KLC4_CLUHA|nr:cytochrome P450 2M1-like isoform X2 [Clupea harengus]